MLLKKREDIYSCIFRQKNCLYQIEVKDGKLSTIYVTYFDNDKGIQKKEEPCEKYEILEKLYQSNIKDYCDLLGKLSKSETYYAIGLQKVKAEKKRIEKALVHINNWLLKNNEEES